MQGKKYKYIGRVNGDFSKIDELIKNYKDYASKQVLVTADENTLDDKSEVTKLINERINLYKSWGYNEFNTVFYQVFNHQYTEIFQPLIDMSGLKKAVSSFITQTPGNTLPMHQDTFINFKLKNNIDPKNPDVVRYMIFMEDWQPGHTFLVEDEDVSYWKKGDMVFWGDKYHLGSNGGSVPKTTLNITGISDSKSPHNLENPKLIF